MILHQDSRTLAEFYPEARQRAQLHYAFAHRFLPRYVHDNPFSFVLELPVGFESEEARRRGMLCEWANPGEHRNPGWMVPVERTSFRQAVEAMFKL